MCLHDDEQFRFKKSRRTLVQIDYCHRAQIEVDTKLFIIFIQLILFTFVI